MYNSEWFKEKQAELGFTNEKMARKLRVSLTLVEKIRMGQRVVTARTATQIEALLKLKELLSDISAEEKGYRKELGL